MSDHKKVIHVKDLVIKADNVHIEPRRPRRDPFFGPRPGWGMERYGESTDEASYDNESSEKESSDAKESSGERGERRRFPWF
ncbi:hypothetical protein [Lentibacillus salinarum]|uniref:Uncharacterized protein n=1 Tax=Lentibacillus salinarum TaxID=446820 RepID=A0ABW3ZP84_9BACI